jgi:hypothetical protein
MLLAFGLGMSVGTFLGFCLAAAFVTGGIDE